MRVIRPLALAAAVFMTVAACGSSAPQFANTRAATHTITVTGAQANRQENAVAKACGTLTPKAMKACTKATAPSSNVEVVSCGNRIYTEGACDFSRQVIVALDDAYPVPPDHPVRVVAQFGRGAKNPSRCGPIGPPGPSWVKHGTWVCRSLKSGMTATWRAAG